MAAADTILIVDDEYSLVESLADILGMEGYATLSARNGRQALELLERTRPTLLLLDFMMPVMDGIQLLEAMDKKGLLAQIPVILMTAAPMGLPKENRKWTALLIKPFELDELISLVRRVLDTHRPD